MCINMVARVDEMFNWELAIESLERRLAEREAMLKPMKVLVVDDSPEDIRLTLALLEHYNCVATPCSEATEAVELISNGDFDLVLMDMKMPQLDGVQIIRIASQRTNQMARVVIMTDMAVNPIVDESLRLGAVWANKSQLSKTLRTFLRTK